MAAALLQWAGWRRHGPAAFSVVAHAGVGVIVAIALVGQRQLQPVKQSEKVMSVDLIAIRGLDDLPMPLDVPSPPGVVRKPDIQKTATSTPVAGPPGQQQGGPPAVVATPMDEGGVAIGPPLGLQGLMASDPCTTKAGLKAKDPKCAGTNWAAVVKPEDALLPQSKQDKKKYYAEFQPTCRDWVGCDGGEWISPNGTRSVFNEHGSPMMGGAAGVGGITSVTTRLPPQPDFRDRGFGD